MAAEWTLAELARRVAEALAAGDVRAPNGRVTGFPDARVIRWYTTIGLVDRPETVGRTARYGPRQLLQLVAIKRRQAQGRTIAEIQLELAGATDATLRRVAGQPEPAPGAPATVERATPPRFWANPAPGPSSAPEPVSAPLAVPSQSLPPPDNLGEVHGLPLGGGALLLVPSAAVGRHAPAIRAAARPLLDLLASLGLLDPSDRPPLRHPDEGAPA